MRPSQESRTVHSFTPSPSGAHSAKRANEPAGPFFIRDIGQFAQQLLIVRVVVALRAAIPRGKNSRRAAERVDLDAGIIGQRQQAGELRQRARLFERVLLKGRTVFDHRRRSWLDRAAKQFAAAGF